MREKPRDVRVQLPPLQAYLDDLTRVESVVARSCESVRVETETYEAASLSELVATDPGRPKTLKIVGSDPYIVVHLSPVEGIACITGADDLSSRGLVGRVSEVVLGLRWPPGRLLSLPFVGVYLGGLAAGVMCSLLIVDPQSWLHVVAGVGLLAGALAYMWAQYHMQARSYCKIHLVPRDTAQGFFQRHGDILKYLIAGAIGAGVPELVKAVVKMVSRSG